MYSKKSGKWYAVPIKTPTTYNYIIEMQMDAVRRRMADTALVARRRKVMAEDPRRMCNTMAPTAPPPTIELVRRHSSRMTRGGESR